MNSFHDGNGVHTLIAVENDGATLINIKADPDTHVLKTSDGTSGTDKGPYDSRHDESHIPVLLAVSSRTATINGKQYIQGITPVVVYADASGNLLVDSV